MNEEKAEESVARSLYFDIVPENAIANVVRFLSESPRAEKWANNIDLAKILGLYHLKGELGAFMFTLSTTLRLNSANITGLSSSESEPAKSIGGEPEYLLDSSIPERVAESFCTLVIGYDVVYEVAKRHVEFISGKFPNIRELILECMEGSEQFWIKKLGVSPLRYRFY